MYRDKTNVEHEMYDSAANDWGQRKSDKRPKQKFGSHTGKHNRYITKDSYK